jgi:arginase
MKKIYLSAPQWQDSGLSKELFEGAIALRNYFKARFNIETINIDIDTSKKPELENNILGFRLLKKQLSNTYETLNTNNPDKIITLGGGCGIELPIVSFLSRKYPDLHLFWFDAHGDLNSPESSGSKHFHGMPLRFITENQNNDMFKDMRLIPPHNVYLIGTRDLDNPEVDYIRKKNIRSIEISQEYSSQVNECIQPNKNAYIHIDLDVLNPTEYRNVKCPVKNGLGIKELGKSLKLFMEKMNVVGISMLENTETKESEIEKLNVIIKQMVYL